MVGYIGFGLLSVAFFVGVIRLLEIFFGVPEERLKRPVRRL
jgi:hypothetical protein